jgi:hypothetical protein
MTPRDYVSILRDSRVNPLVKGFKSATIEQAIKVWDIASDEEKSQLRPVLLRKIAMARREGKQISPEIIERVR